MTFNRSSRPARLLAAAFATCLALGFALPAAAQWKWKDKSGRVQYSDLPPPPTVSDADILQRPNGASLRKAAPAFAAEGAGSAAASTAPTAAASGVDPELEAKRRKSSEEDAAKKRAEEEKQKAARAENCQRAKNQLRALEDGMRMARVNAKGEREILDDKGRAEEAKRARDVMASECK